MKSAYLEINEIYTVTVHSCDSLREYTKLWGELIDWDTVAVVRTHEDKEEQQLIDAYISIKRAEQNGYATFNSGEHHCIDLGDGTTAHTISIKVGNELVTFAYCPTNTPNKTECIDIYRHTGPSTNENGSKEHRVITFQGGLGSTKSEGTLTAILLSNHD